MVDRQQIYDAGWFASLPHSIQGLIKQAVFLLERERGLPHSQEVHDHGYVVFPAAKAFEGFLKEYFFNLGLISKKTYYDEYFRIGKALNPDLPKRFRDHEWLTQTVAEVCSPELADTLWRTWRQARNKVFHYRENKSEGISLEEAETKIELIVHAIEAAVACETVAKRDE